MILTLSFPDSIIDNRSLKDLKPVLDFLYEEESKKRVDLALQRPTTNDELYLAK